MALVQWAASAAKTAGVFFGEGPSSKVSTISPSRRKSRVLKCSKPKPGPPVVSISTTREMPSASGVPGHEEPARGTAGGAGADAAGGPAAVGTCADAGAVAAATAGEPWATPVGAFDVTSELGAGLSPVVSTNGARCSSTVVTTDRPGPSADAVCSSDVGGMLNGFASPTGSSRCRLAHGLG